MVPDDWDADTVPLASLVRGTGGRPTRLVLFRRPIELRADTRGDLSAMVHTVLVEQVSELLGRPRGGRPALRRGRRGVTAPPVGAAVGAAVRQAGTHRRSLLAQRQRRERHRGDTTRGTGVADRAADRAGAGRADHDVRRPGLRRPAGGGRRAQRQRGGVDPPPARAVRRDADPRGRGAGAQPHGGPGTRHDGRGRRPGQRRPPPGRGSRRRRPWTAATRRRDARSVSRSATGSPGRTVWASARVRSTERTVPGATVTGSRPVGVKVPDEPETRRSTTASRPDGFATSRVAGRLGRGPRRAAGCATAPRCRPATPVPVARSGRCAGSRPGRRPPGRARRAPTARGRRSAARRRRARRACASGEPPGRRGWRRCRPRRPGRARAGRRRPGRGRGSRAAGWSGGRARHPPR